MTMIRSGLQPRGEQPTTPCRFRGAKKTNAWVKRGDAFVLSPSYYFMGLSAKSPYQEAHLIGTNLGPTIQATLKLLLNSSCLCSSTDRAQHPWSKRTTPSRLSNRPARTTQKNTYAGLPHFKPHHCTSLHPTHTPLTPPSRQIRLLSEDAEPGEWAKVEKRGIQPPKADFFTEFLALSGSRLEEVLPLRREKRTVTA